MKSRISSYPVILLVISVSGLTSIRANSGTNVQHWIDYKLESGRLHTVPISHKGPKFVVGDSVLKKMDNTNERTSLKCREQDNERNYRDLFRTKLSVKLGETQEDFVELKNKTYYSELFTVTRQQVWTCSNEHNPSEKRVGVIRVLNELVGTGAAELQQVSYRDGVNVIPYLSSFNTRTAIIQELKYLDVYTGVPVKYVGVIDFEDEDSSSSTALNRNNHIAEFYNTPCETIITKRADGSFTEVNYKLAHATTATQLSITGYKGGLEIGSISGTAYGVETDIHNCTEYQGLNPLPFMLRPKLGLIPFPVALNVPLDTTDTYFNQVTPISHQVWYCELQTNKKKYFFRVVNELITRRGHDKIEYFSDLVQLRTVRMPTGHQRALRFKTIRYYSDTLQPIKYVGGIRLHSYPKTDYLFRTYSSDMQVTRTREIEYILKEGRAYRTIVGSQGLNIKVNSKWIREIGNENDVVTCKLQANNNSTSYSQAYGMKIEVLIWINNREETHALPRRLHKHYWHVVEQTLWLCSLPENRYSFLRVLNKLEGLKEFYEVQYYDGVVLNRRYLGKGRQSVTLTETKYMDPVTNEILKFRGILELKGKPSSSIWRCTECIGTEIRTSSNEIVLEKRPDLLPTNVNIRRFGTKLENNRFNTDGKRLATYYFQYNVGDNFGNLEDVYECHLEDVFDEKFYPSITYVNPETNIASSAETSHDATAKYLKFEKVDVFLCSEVKTRSYKLSQEGLSVIDGKTFSMVESEIVLDGKINIFLFFGGEYSHDKTTTRVKLTQFFNINDRKLLKYVGWLRIFKTNDDYSDVMSGTVDLREEFKTIKRNKEFFGGGQDFRYKSYSERFYRLEIDDSETKVLKLGEDYSTSIEVGTKDDLVRCRRDLTTPESEFISEYRTKCSSIRNNRDFTENFDEHFSIYHWEIWNCYIVGDNILKLKRIVNHFTLQTLPDKKRKIKEIRYYDGMSIEVGTNVYDLPSWDFTEIKYTSPDSSNVVLYYGKLELITEDNHIEEKIYPSPKSQSSLFDVYGHSIKYTLLNHLSHQSFSKQGLNVRIGDRHEKEFNEVDKLRCEELDHDGLKYRTKAYIFSDYTGGEGLSVFKEMSSEQFQRHFKIITSKLWQCKPDKAVKDANFKLFRVDTWLELLNVQATIFYHEGVFIDQGSTNGAIFKEIKYIDPSDGKLTKYEGFIRYEPSILINHLHQYSTEALRISRRELFYPLRNKVIHVKYLNEDGIVLIIGMTVEESSFSKNDIIVCQLSPYNGQYYMFNGLTRDVYPIILTNDEKKSITTKYSSVQFNKLFKSKRKQIWRCTLNSKFAFFKIVERYEFELPVSMVMHADGVMVWSRRTADGKEVTTFREVYYHDGQSQVEFGGRIININTVKKVNYPKLLSQSSAEVTQAPTSEQFTKQWTKNAFYKSYEHWKRTPYALKEPLQNVIYSEETPQKSIITYSNGFDIRVGSHWETEIGSKRDEYECEIADKSQYEKSALMTKFIISMQDDEIETDEESIKSFFTVKNQEVSICSSSDEEKSFLRVVTELQGTVGVRYLEYYDGVQFISVPLDGSDNTANILEIKYLELDTGSYKLIKFAGSLVKKSPSDGWLYTIRVPVPVYHPDAHLYSKTPLSTQPTK